MFPDRSWFERNLPAIGLWMFAIGVVCLVAGVLGSIYYQDRLIISDGATPLPGSFRVFSDVVYGLGTPLIYSGVTLYLAGLVLGAWSISLVGFEHSDGKTLLVKGPDAENTVWIGRRYEAVFEAEAASSALRQRFPGKEADE
jgi:hypothetical protein